LKNCPHDCVVYGRGCPEQAVKNGFRSTCREAYYSLSAL
jgi:hypothetical protein